MAELSNSSREPAIEFAKAMRKTHPNLPLAFNDSSSFSGAATRTRCRSGSSGVSAQWTLETTKAGHPTESHHVMARVAHIQELAKRFNPGSRDRIKGSHGFDVERAH